jgi:hypothetical protein
MNEMGYEDMKWMQLVEHVAHNKAFTTVKELPVP